MLIDPLFDSVELGPVLKKKAYDISVAFTVLIDALNEICPAGREYSLVRTKLEEASFYAKKSILVLRRES